MDTGRELCQPEEPPVAPVTWLQPVVARSPDFSRETRSLDWLVKYSPI